MSLGLVNAANARDLGGLPTIDGRVVRTGVVFRANALNRLTDADVEAVGRLGLACLIDFRHSREIELVGVDRLPEPPPSRVVSMPLFDPEDDIFTHVGAATRGLADPSILLRLRENHPSGGAPAAMRDVYRWFVTAPAATQTFAAALRLLATPECLPLLFHCTAGKDRTGWLAALLLSILGVDRTQVVADYLRTNEDNSAAIAFIIGRAGQHVPEPEVLQPLLVARPEYLQVAFDEVDRVGGIGAYARGPLGLDDETIAALRANLLI